MIETDHLDRVEAVVAKFDKTIYAIYDAAKTLLSIPCEIYRMVNGVSPISRTY